MKSSIVMSVPSPENVGNLTEKAARRSASLSIALVVSSEASPIMFAANETAATRVGGATLDCVCVLLVTEGGVKAPKPRCTVVGMYEGPAITVDGNEVCTEGFGRRVSGALGRS